LTQRCGYGSVAATMATEMKNESYFAPSSPTAPVSTVSESPTWGDDAADIAQTAGLGSYGAETLEQQAREEAVIRGLERMDGQVFGQVQALRGLVNWLCVCVVVLGAAVGWMLIRAR